jgi:hypothetical protein
VRDPGVVDDPRLLRWPAWIWPSLSAACLIATAALSAISYRVHIPVPKFVTSSVVGPTAAYDRQCRSAFEETIEFDTEQGNECYVAGMHRMAFAIGFFLTAIVTVLIALVRWRVMRRLQRQARRHPHLASTAK